MKTRAQVDDVISQLAAGSGLEREVIRMLWLNVACQARPVGAPVETYVMLAREHHGIAVEVIDLGARSMKQCNSCMFLTCAAAVADHLAKGREDALPPGLLGERLADAMPGTNASQPMEEILEQHRRTRAGTLGRMADVLREAACDMLTSDADFFRPYFHPTRTIVQGGDEAMRKAYVKWVERLRGDEEGDELVLLALTRLLGMAVQPVQQSGYKVPLMDPTGAAESDFVSYWGNDDRHWVWLRPTGYTKPTAAPIAEPSGGGAPAAQPASGPAAGPGAAEPGPAAGVGSAKEKDFPIDLF